MLIERAGYNGGYRLRTKGDVAAAGSCGFEAGLLWVTGDRARRLLLPLLLSGVPGGLLRRLCGDEGCCAAREGEAGSTDEDEDEAAGALVAETALRAAILAVAAAALASTAAIWAAMAVLCWWYSLGETETGCWCWR